eukprot:5520601-Prorocentrum_lima.AAC.1
MPHNIQSCTITYSQYSRNCPQAILVIKERCFAHLVTVKSLFARCHAAHRVRLGRYPLQERDCVLRAVHRPSVMLAETREDDWFVRNQVFAKEFGVAQVRSFHDARRRES